MTLDGPTVPPIRITVIIAVYNGAQTLQRALDSVFEQTYGDIELIVMDGGSSDRSPAILESNTAHITFWESEPDKGIYQAWNKALDHATGDWIHFLGADDRYHAPDILERVAATLRGVEDRYRVAYGSVHQVTVDGDVSRILGVPWTDQRRRAFLRGKMIPHQGAFHHRTLFTVHGRFDEGYRIAGDYELLLRELQHHDPLFLPDVIVDMGIGGLSSHPRTLSLMYRELYKARYVHGTAGTPPWRSRQLLRRRWSLWVAHTVRPLPGAIRRCVGLRLGSRR